MSKSKKKTYPADSKHWRTKADELFMRQYRGKPCAVCGKTEGTVGHHIVPKSRGRALRYDQENMLVLCPLHHMYSNEIAAHSFNSVAVGRFWAWLQKEHPEKMAWVEKNCFKPFNGDWTYKSKYYELLGNIETEKEEKKDSMERPEGENRKDISMCEHGD